MPLRTLFSEGGGRFDEADKALHAVLSIPSCYSCSSYAIVEQLHIDSKGSPSIKSTKGDINFPFTMCVFLKFNLSEKKLEERDRKVR